MQTLGVLVEHGRQREQTYARSQIALTRMRWRLFPEARAVHLVVEADNSGLRQHQFLRRFNLQSFYYPKRQYLKIK